MRTRRTSNLAHVKIHDLMLPDKSKEEIPPILEKKANSLTKVHEIIRTQQRMVTQLENRIDQMEMTRQGSNTNGLLSGVHIGDSVSSPRGEDHIFLVLDTESYRVSTELGSQSLIPLQVAWAVCRWNKQLKKLETLKRVICYVSEVICTSRLRDAIRSISERNFLKHEAKLQSTKYPMLSIKKIFEGLLRYIRKFKVKTLAAYNISWDFEALRNLLRLFYPGANHNCPVLSSFSSECDNPFNLFRISHVDLMHEVVKKYGDQLVESGVKDGTISRKNGKVMLRKDKLYSKTVFSAEYVLHDFFNVSQRHLADDDVEHERLLLEKCLCDFGADRLEYGVLYPQSSSFQIMIRKATHALKDVPDESTERKNMEKTECWFLEEDDE